MTPTAALLLALAVPAAPAPKADTGLPKDLIDLLPEDTAGVLILDVPKAARSEIGKAVLKAVTAEQQASDPVQVADFVRDAELVVVAQFLIDKAFGDFCILVRHTDKSNIPKTLIDRADKAGKDTAPERIGKRTVYSINDPGVSFARVDDRTLMFVLATGTEKQVQETRAAAFGEREKPGPSQSLRKMLADDGKDARPVRLYGSHPKKLGLSASLALAPFGVRDKVLEGFDDKVVSYRGGIKAGDTAEVEVRFTARDADAARQLLKAYEAGEQNDPFVKELRAAAKVVRDGDDVVVTARLTAAMLGRAIRDPNK